MTLRYLMLGLRLSWGTGRSGRIRIGLLALGAGVAAFVVLTSVAFTSVAQRQAERGAAIAPLRDDTFEAHLVGDVVLDGWEDRELRRVVLATRGPDAAVPPGLDRVPAVDEVAVSPALARLIADEPLVARRFPQHRTAVIRPDGLVEPGQLLAYVGVRADELGHQATPIAGFGNPIASSNLDPGAARIVGLLVLVMLIAPVIAFLVTCARLSATARSQRLAALRLLGLDPGRTQLVNALETGIVGLLGGAGGLVAWTVWRALMPSVEVASYGWFNDDLRLSPLMAAGVVLGLASLSVAVGAIGSRPSIAQPLQVRRERSVRSVSAWRAVPMIVGLVLLGVSWTTSGDQPGSLVRWLLPFGAGMLLTAVGIVLVVPILARSIGRLLGRSTHPAAILAGGRLRHEPAVAGRVLATMAIALFAVGFAQVVVTLATTFSVEEDDFPEVMVLQAWGPLTGPERYQGLSDLGMALPTWPLTPDGGVKALAATCGQLQTLTGAELSECRDGEVHRVQSPELYAQNAGPTVVDGALVAAGLPPATRELALPVTGEWDLQTPTVIVPPDHAPTVATTYTVAFSGSSYDEQHLIASLAERAPAAFWSPMIAPVHQEDGARIYGALVGLGSAAALAIGLAALTVATIDRSVERRRAQTHLTALGAPARTLRWAIVLQNLPVSLTVFVASGVAAMVGGSSLLRGAEAGISLPFTSMLLMTALAVVAAIVATAGALIGGLTATRPTELLRNE